jgi:hypothetical protein
MPEMHSDAACGGSEQTPVAVVTAEGEGRLSVTEAARAVATARHQKPAPGSDRGPTDQQDGEQRTQGAVQQPPAQESAEEAGATPPEAEARGEIESVDAATTDPRAEPGTGVPSIEPPGSWTKEDKELFTSLPRATQERIAERERSRESDFLRRQNEAADKLKGLAAKEQTAEQAKQHYEAALPLILNMLQQQQAADFADVKTLADVERLAREDAARYARWDVQQKKIADVSRQLTSALVRQVLERQQKFSEFAQREDEVLKQKLPDMADADKAAKLQNVCLAALRDLGFDDAELVQSWHGQKDFSLRDHRVQLLIRDAALWREAQQKAKAATTKPVPPVQRPGVAQPKGAAQAARIQSLTQQLENAKGVNALRAAADLVKARRASSR